MDSFSALHKYDLEIRLHRRDLYQTSAFCGHVFTMNLLLKNVTLGHMTENKCGNQMHIFVTSFSTQHAPVWRCFCMVQPLRQPFRPKCTTRILQMHHQNPVVPPESDVHSQNPVCTYSVGMLMYPDYIMVTLCWCSCIWRRFAWMPQNTELFAISSDVIYLRSFVVTKTLHGSRLLLNQYQYAW